MKKGLLFLLLCVGIKVFAQDTITKKDISAAAKLFDLSFTEKEIDTMYAGVKENLIGYRQMHKYTIDNSVQMSMAQNPVLPGMIFPAKQEKIKWSTEKISMPSNINELAFYSISQLAYLIKTKQISSVALTQFFIDRIKKYGDTLACVISITDSIALDQAKKADEEISAGKYKGLLHGIPYGLKDLF